MFESAGGLFGGKIVFRDSSSVHITEGYGYWHDVSSGYVGKEIPSSDVKFTRFFYIQFDITKKVSLGDSVVIGSDEWVITGIKAIGGHTEVTGLKKAASVGAVAESGIVSEYRFSSSDELGTDEQGSNPLTLLNTPVYSSESGTNASPQDGSVDLESSSSQRLEISDTEQQGLDITGSLTIVARIKLESLPVSGVYTIASKYNGSTNDRSYRLEVTGAGNIKSSLSNDGTNDTTCTGGTAMTTATWYAVALVYDGVDIRLYIDGTLDTNGSQNPKTYTSGIYNSASKFVVGGRSSSDYFDGLIDDVQIFNESKTAAKILTWSTTGSWS